MKQHLEKYLPNSPVTIDEKNWFYLVSKGIEIIHEVSDKGEYVKTDHVLVPWKKVEKALEAYKEAVKNRK
jgi:hypothetical protein